MIKTNPLVELLEMIPGSPKAPIPCREQHEVEPLDVQLGAHATHQRAHAVLLQLHFEREVHVGAVDFRLCRPDRRVANLLRREDTNRVRGQFSSL